MAQTIGDSGAPSSLTYNADALLSTTLFNYRKVMVDNIFRNSVLLSTLRMNNGIVYTDGGERVAQPLMYESNSTVGSYTGYDVIDTTPQDGMTTAYYPWTQLAATIAISRLEERQNNSEAKILDLLRSKITQAEMTMREELNTQLIRGTVSSSTFINGNGGKDAEPLGYFLSKSNSTDPTGTGVTDVGNISRNTYSWWRHNDGDLSAGGAGNTFDLTVTTYKGLIVGLKRMYNYCSRGSGGSPTIVMMDQGSFETYESAVDERSRIQNTKLGEIGFDSLKLRGADCVWDEVVPDINNGTAAITTGTAFFINTDFYKLAIDRATDFITTDFMRPENQDAKVAQVLWMGAACSSNQRKHGVCYGISQSIVA
jgi:hypothetical protein